MNIIWDELTTGLPDTEQMLRIAVRLIVATLLGALLGFQRERLGKPAGLRTHMLVALGSALFVLAPAGVAINLGDTTRIIQGIATGIGFIGTGAILKRSDQSEVQGLTTAAGIWLTAAVGVAAGLGRLGPAILSAALAWVILTVLSRISERIEESNSKKARPNPDVQDCKNDTVIIDE